MKTLVCFLAILILIAAACRDDHPAIVAAVNQAQAFLIHTEMERGPAHDELQTTISGVIRNYDLCWWNKSLDETPWGVADAVVADAMARAYHHLILVEFEKAGPIEKEGVIDEL